MQELQVNVIKGEYNEAAKQKNNVLFFHDLSQGQCPGDKNCTILEKKNS